MTCLIIIYSGTSWVTPVLRPCPRSFISSFSSLFLDSMVWKKPPFFGAQVFTLYSPSRLILTLHLFIRQAPIQIPIPSAAYPCFLLVALTETTLFRRLFSLIRLGHLWAHSMRRWHIYLEPPPLRTPMWVPFYSPLLLGAFWRQPSTRCHSSPWSLGMPRTGSSSAASLGYLIFHHLSSATTLLGTGPRP